MVLCWVWLKSKRGPTWVTATLVSVLVIFGSIRLSQGSADSRSLASSQFSHLTPEYGRTMKSVMISLGAYESDLRFQDAILQNLPDYTEVFLLVPQMNVNHIRKLLQRTTYGHRVSLIPYETGLPTGSHIYYLFAEQSKLKEVCVDEPDMAYKQGTKWAQDLFEVGVDPLGQAVLLVSEVHKYYTASQISDQTVLPELQVSRDTAFVGKLASPTLTTKLAPFAFMGGNLIADLVDGRKLVICGGDILRTTRTTWLARNGEPATDEQIIATIKQFFKADDVFVLSQKRLQPNLMDHLDQAVVLLPGKIAGVERIVGPGSEDHLSGSPEIRAVKEFLDETRVLLESLGYRIVDIEVSTANVNSLQHYANSITYRDLHTGQGTIMIPRFRECTNPEDIALFNRNKATFENLGLKVVQVPTSADVQRGGIHCLVNVFE